MRNKKAQSLISVIVTIAIFVLILRIVVEQIIKINISQNELNAQATLKLISTALENYAKDNQGVFPPQLAVLSQTKPPYLDKNYTIQAPMKGYNYYCSRLEPAGYSCSAVALKCSITGKKNYTITTGGSLGYEDCARKD